MSINKKEIEKIIKRECNKLNLDVTEIYDTSLSSIKFDIAIKPFYDNWASTTLVIARPIKEIKNLTKLSDEELLNNIKDLIAARIITSMRFFASLNLVDISEEFDNIENPNKRKSKLEEGFETMTEILDAQKQYRKILQNTFLLNSPEN